MRILNGGMTGRESKDLLLDTDDAMTGPSAELVVVAPPCEICDGGTIHGLETCVADDGCERDGSVMAGCT